MDDEYMILTKHMQITRIKSVSKWVPTKRCRLFINKIGVSKTNDFETKKYIY